LAFLKVKHMEISFPTKKNLTEISCWYLKYTNVVVI
jgi:hypothetical protein